MAASVKGKFWGPRILCSLYCYKESLPSLSCAIGCSSSVGKSVNLMGWRMAASFKGKFWGPRVLCSLKVLTSQLAVPVICLWSHYNFISQLCKADDTQWNILSWLRIHLLAIRVCKMVFWQVTHRGPEWYQTILQVQELISAMLWPILATNGQSGSSCMACVGVRSPVQVWSRYNKVVTSFLQSCHIPSRPSVWELIMLCTTLSRSTV